MSARQSGLVKLLSDGPAVAAGPGSAEASAGTVLNVVGARLCLERDGQVLLVLRHPDSA